jgi:heme A synthase
MFNDGNLKIDSNGSTNGKSLAAKSSTKELGEMGASKTEGTAKLTLRKFRILLVAIVAILVVQGWSGDTVNIFYAPTTGATAPPFSLAGFISEIESLGGVGTGLLFWHMAEGILLTILAVAAFALSFYWSKSRAVRIASGLGLLFIIFAAMGGFEFVLSGFSNGGNSAQMGGSFLGAFAFYFIALFYSK